MARLRFEIPFDPSRHGRVASSDSVIPAGTILASTRPVKFYSMIARAHPDASVIFPSPFFSLFLLLLSPMTNDQQFRDSALHLPSFVIPICDPNCFSGAATGETLHGLIAA
jgi:hypothetical protein